MNLSMKPTKTVFWSARRKSFANETKFILQYDNDIRGYCLSMANAIREELQRHQHCWLIDHAFSDGYIFSLDWAIIQALRSAQNTDARFQPAFPIILQMLPISESMETEMLSLCHKTPAAVNSSAPETRNASVIAETNELKARLEQLNQTKSDLENQISRLKDETEKLQAEKQEEQNRIRNQILQLKSEAEKIRTENQEKQELIQNQINAARLEAEAVLREAREKADDIRTALMQGFADEAAPEAVPADENSLRDTVGSETLRLETTIRSSLDSYRDEIHKMLYEFRTGLYKADYTSLCFAYQKLYLFAAGTFDKRIDSLCAELGSEELAAQVQSSLRKVQGQLLRRVTAMEESFRKLGLTVFRPESGEEYNDVYHAAENVEDDGYLDAVVRCCVCPGICADEQVLCRAAVMVDAAKHG